MRFLFPMSSMVLLACVACGASAGDVSAPIPPADSNDPSFRPDEPQDPNFRPDYVPVADSGDSGSVVVNDDGGVVSTQDGEAGLTYPDSGLDPTDPDDALCSPGVRRTCEDSLHCCMKVCKALHAGDTLPNGVVVPGCTNGVHVDCVHRCSEAHEECVEERRKADCNK
jgi:hypothetical protein